MDADRALGGQRDVALAADRAAGRCDEDARERGVGVVIGRRGEPERFGSKAGEADIAVRAQFNAAGKNAVRRDARRAKVDLAGPRSATRRFDHDAAARSLSRIAEAAVPAAALTRAAAAGRSEEHTSELQSLMRL